MTGSPMDRVCGNCGVDLRPAGSIGYDAEKPCCGNCWWPINTWHVPLGDNGACVTQIDVGDSFEDGVYVVRDAEGQEVELSGHEVEALVKAWVQSAVARDVARQMCEHLLPKKRGDGS